MMKRGLVLLALLCFMLVGCSNKSATGPTDEQVETYSNAAAKWTDVKGVDMSLKMSYPNLGVFAEVISLMPDGLQVDMILSDLTMSDINTLEGFISLKSGFMDMDTYIKDGMMYVDIYGQKVKGPVTLDELGLPDMDTFKNVTIDTSEIKDFTVTEEGNVLSFELLLDTEEKINNYNAKYGGGLASDYSDLGEGLKAQSMKLGYKIDKSTNEFKDILVEITLVDEESKETGALSVELIINSMGDITIDFPDLSEYIEIE